MDKIVYICHCIDTEGPLYEPISASFERLHDLFGIDLPATEENLLKIQKGEIDFGDKSKSIMDVFSKKRLSTLGKWDDIDKVLDEILNNTYRNTLLDSYGNGWIYNWFCMDHAGFNGDNPRKRDSGFHKIYDHYSNLLTNYNHDTIQFHFHPIPFKGHYNLYATSYVSNPAIFEILARDIIDRHYFPVAYRPGFNTERPDSHWFLEQYIPFDFGNQSTKYDKMYQPDTENGRFGNWSHAPLEWNPYHPDYKDYQQIGNCERWITRCLNIDARIGKITENDVVDAFNTAKEKGKSLLAFTNHDFRDMRPEIEYMKNIIRKVSKRYPDVKFAYSNVIDAMRNVLELEKKDTMLICNVSKKDNVSVLHIKSTTDIFGPQPFLAIKTIDNKYYWDNLDFGRDNNWYYSFDANTFNLNDVEKIGIAANNSYGQTNVCVIDVNDINSKNIFESKSLNR